MSRGTYKVGDIIYDNDSGTINFYQCNTDDAAGNAFDGGSVTIPALNGNFTTFSPGQSDTNFAGYNIPSPWTGSSGTTTVGEAWLQNMTEGEPSGYRGSFVDWNVTRANYDRININDEFEKITQKWVTRRSNSPPTSGELFHGQRILVGQTPTSGS